MIDPCRDRDGEKVESVQQLSQQPNTRRWHLVVYRRNLADVGDQRDEIVVRPPVELLRRHEEHRPAVVPNSVPHRPSKLSVRIVVANPADPGGEVRGSHDTDGPQVIHELTTEKRPVASCAATDGEGEVLATSE